MTDRTEINCTSPEQGMAQLGVMLGGVLLFARQVVAHAKAGGAMDDDELARIQAQCIFELKNTGTLGLSVQDEATAISQALRQLEQLLGSVR